MPSCVIRWCKNTSTNAKKDDGITWHSFPLEKEKHYEDWRRVIRYCRGDPEWEPTKYTKICSIHFDDNEFYVTKYGRRRIYEDSIPSKLLFGPEEIENAIIAKPGATKAKPEGPGCPILLTQSLLERPKSESRPGEPPGGRKSAIMIECEPCDSHCPAIPFQTVILPGDQPSGVKPDGPTPELAFQGDEANLELPVQKTGLDMPSLDESQNLPDVVAKPIFKLPITVNKPSSPFQESLASDQANAVTQKSDQTTAGSELQVPSSLIQGCLPGDVPIASLNVDCLSEDVPTSLSAFRESLLDAPVSSSQASVCSNPGTPPVQEKVSIEESKPILPSPETLTPPAPVIKKCVTIKQPLPIKKRLVDLPSELSLRKSIFQLAPANPVAVKASQPSELSLGKSIFQLAPPEPVAIKASQPSELSLGKSIFQLAPSEPVVIKASQPSELSLGKSIFQLAPPEPVVINASQPSELSLGKSIFQLAPSEPVVIKASQPSESSLDDSVFQLAPQKPIAVKATGMDSCEPPSSSLTFQTLNTVYVPRSQLLSPEVSNPGLAQDSLDNPPSPGQEFVKDVSESASAPITFTGLIPSKPGREMPFKQAVPVAKAIPEATFKKPQAPPKPPPTESTPAVEKMLMDATEDSLRFTCTSCGTVNVLPNVQFQDLMPTPTAVIDGDIEYEPMKFEKQKKFKQVHLYKIDLLQQRIRRLERTKQVLKAKVKNYGINIYRVIPKTTVSK